MLFADKFIIHALLPIFINSNQKRIHDCESPLTEKNLILEIDDFIYTDNT